MSVSIVHPNRHHSDHRIDDLLANAYRIRRELIAHSLYERVNSANAARVFMSHHVFAVWDFMSLLKSLQRKLTCVGVPWLPPEDTWAARLINEIVLAEETDEDDRGGYIGHYELYQEAMRDVGADARGISRLVIALRAGASLDEALAASRAPDTVRQFVRTTIDIATNGATHEIAAAFFLGRESVIPEMFSQLITSLDRVGSKMTGRLKYYLARHVEVDGGAHGPAAERLLRLLCGDDHERWKEADASASRALRRRIELWDSVARTLDEELPLAAARRR